MVAAVAGLLVGLVYHHFGKSVEGGNNLLIDEIHDPKRIVPKRMAPLILVDTVVTHLFGGSAGRKGTAVQMGGALADMVTRICRFAKRRSSYLADCWYQCRVCIGIR